MTFRFTLCLFLAVYALLMTERFPKHLVVLAGTLILLLARVLTVREAVHYVNLSTLVILLGLFVIVEIGVKVGLFEWLASQIVRRFRHRPTFLFIMLPILTGLLACVVNNITVMVFMTTLTLEIGQVIALPLLPLIVGEVCCANMLGASTLIGAPPNLVLASTLGYGFHRVAIHMAPLALLATMVFMIVHYFQHRHALANLSTVSEQSRSPRATKSFRIDIETLLFFTGLFILVGALDHVGLFIELANFLNTVHQPVSLILSVLWFSAIASALVDNIPMALAMAYLIKNLSGLSPSFPAGIVVWAALIGLTLGGNMTPIGASPNVVAYGLLEKDGQTIGWKKWARLTIPATLSALVMVSVAIYAKYQVGWY